MIINAMTIKKLLKPSKKDRENNLAFQKKTENHREFIISKCKIIKHYGNILAYDKYYKTISQIFALDARRIINMTRGDSRTRSIWTRQDFWKNKKVYVDDVNEFNLLTINDIYRSYLLRPRTKKKWRYHKKSRRRYYFYGKPLVNYRPRYLLKKIKNNRKRRLKILVKEKNLKKRVRKILFKTIKNKKLVRRRVLRLKKTKPSGVLKITGLKKDTEKAVIIFKKPQKVEKNTLFAGMLALTKAKTYGKLDQKRELKKLFGAHVNSWKTVKVDKKKKKRNRYYTRQFRGYRRKTATGIYFKAAKRSRRLLTQLERLIIKLKRRLKMPIKILRFAVNVIFKLDPKIATKTKYNKLSRTLLKLLRVAKKRRKLIKRRKKRYIKQLLKNLPLVKIKRKSRGKIKRRVKLTSKQTLKEKNEKKLNKKLKIRSSRKRRS